MTRFKEIEHELTLLETELQTFSETMYPEWKAIKDNLLGRNEIGNNESFDNLSQKVMNIQSFWLTILFRIWKR